MNHNRTTGGCPNLIFPPRSHKMADEYEQDTNHTQGSQKPEELGEDMKPWSAAERNEMMSIIKIQRTQEAEHDLPTTNGHTLWRLVSQQMLRKNYNRTEQACRSQWITKCRAQFGFDERLAYRIGQVRESASCLLISECQKFAR